MKLLFQVCSALSLGLAVGLLLGGFKALARRGRSYSQAQVQKTRRLLSGTAAVLKYVTFLCIGLGLVWCLYYLVLGAVNPAQAEYATNMSQLIVSVLTAISILFAFFEFVRRTNGGDK